MPAITRYLHTMYRITDPGRSRVRLTFVRHPDGKITDHWNIVDVAGLLLQLGVASGP
jgi:hypothetical protein